MAGELIEIDNNKGNHKYSPSLCLTQFSPGSHPDYNADLPGTL